MAIVGGREELTIEVTVAGQVSVMDRVVDLVSEDVYDRGDARSKDEERPARQRERLDELPSRRRTTSDVVLELLLLLLGVDLVLEFLRERGRDVLWEGGVVFGHLVETRAPAMVGVGQDTAGAARTRPHVHLRRQPPVRVSD